MSTLNGHLVSRVLAVAHIGLYVTIQDGNGIDTSFPGTWHKLTSWMLGGALRGTSLAGRCLVNALSKGPLP